MCKHSHMRAAHTHTYTLWSPISVLFLTYRPKTDTCKTCDALKVKIDVERNASALIQLCGERDVHLVRAEGAYNQLKEDTALSKSDPDMDVMTFDLQQSLPTPVLSTNVVFYKRQLWSYNFGVHNCRTGVGYMHLWHEGIASRGSHEVGSCILKYIKSLSPTASHLVTYSDSCGGQNRNVYILALWLHIVSSDEYSYTTIDQKFFSYLICRCLALHSCRPSSAKSV